MSCRLPFLDMSTPGDRECEEFRDEWCDRCVDDLTRRTKGATAMSRMLWLRNSRRAHLHSCHTPPRRTSRARSIHNLQNTDREHVEQRILHACTSTHSDNDKHKHDQARPNSHIQTAVHTRHTSTHQEDTSTHQEDTSTHQEDTSTRQEDTSTTPVQVSSRQRITPVVRHHTSTRQHTHLIPDPRADERPLDAGDPGCGPDMDECRYAMPAATSSDSCTSASGIAYCFRSRPLPPPPLRECIVPDRSWSSISSYADATEPRADDATERPERAGDGSGDRLWWPWRPGEGSPVRPLTAVTSSAKLVPEMSCTASLSS